MLLVDQNTQESKLSHTQIIIPHTQIYHTDHSEVPYCVLYPPENIALETVLLHALNQLLHHKSHALLALRVGSGDKYSTLPSLGAVCSPRPAPHAIHPVVHSIRYLSSFYITPVRLARFNRTDHFLGHQKFVAHTKYWWGAWQTVGGSHMQASRSLLRWL